VPLLLIAGTFRVEPAHRDVMLAAARDMMRETLQERGCQAYRFTADLDDPGLVHLFERWESDEALAAHFKMPHMARFQAAVAAHPPQIVEIQRYDVSKVGPVRP